MTRIPTSNRRTLSLNRRSLVQKTAVVGVGGLLISANSRISFAQDATPAVSPLPSPAAGQDMVPSGIEGVPDAYMRMPAAYQSYDGVPVTAAQSARSRSATTHHLRRETIISTGRSSNVDSG